MTTEDNDNEPRVGLNLSTQDGVKHTFHFTTKKARALGLRLMSEADRLEEEAAQLEEAKDNEHANGG